MKKIFLFFGVLLIINSINAQEIFEGKITYATYPSDNKPKNKKEFESSEIILSPSKIKMRFKAEYEDFSPNETIILLDSGMIYKTDVKEKIYSQRNLKKKKKNIIISEIQNFRDSILGMPISMYKTIEGSDTVFLYMAKNLYFPIPPVFQNTADIPGMFIENKIPLKLEIIENSGKWTIEAIEIKAIPVRDTEFIIPSDYIEKEEKFFFPMDIED